MNINDIDRLKDSYQKKASKGFGYFMKNIGMLILMFLAIFVLTTPEAILNPAEYFVGLTIKSLWVVFVLFLLVAGFYQLSKSVQKDNKEELSKSVINDYEKAIDKKEEEKKEIHNELVKERFNVNPLIANELKRLLINLEADRAAILEMHNGTNSLGGLPCIYGDMVYEEISPDVNFATDEFQNFNLAKLPFVSLHYAEGTWIGSVDDIAKEDGYLAAKLRVVGVNYGACVVLEGIYGPLGILTLFFKDEKKHPTKAKIIAELNHSSQILTTLLDKAKEK